jgi:hypothetical protein
VQHESYVLNNAIQGYVHNTARFHYAILETRYHLQPTLMTAVRTPILGELRLWLWYVDHSSVNIRFRLQALLHVTQSTAKPFHYCQGCQSRSNHTAEASPVLTSAGRRPQGALQAQVQGICLSICVPYSRTNSS